MVTPEDSRGSVEPSDPLALVEQAAVAEELLAGQRHAGRTKLATIRNAAYVIRHKLAALDVSARDPRLERFLGHIESEVDELTKILAEGHVTAMLRPARPELISPALGVRRGVETARREKERVTISADMPGSLVLADVDELALAVRCLVENAVDASPEGAQVQIRCVETEDSVCIEVEDAGSGLDAEAITRSLRPFETTRPGRAGLGLSIVRRFAAKSGGDFTLGPGAAGGLVARLALPRQRAGGV